MNFDFDSAMFIFFKERRNFNKSTTQRVEIESKNNLTSSIRFEI